MAVLALKQWFSLKFMQCASIISFESFWKIYLHRWINLEFLWSSLKVVRTSTRVMGFQNTRSLKVKLCSSRVCSLVSILVGAVLKEKCPTIRVAFSLIALRQCFNYRKIPDQDDWNVYYMDKIAWDFLMDLYVTINVLKNFDDSFEKLEFLLLRYASSFFNKYFEIGVFF